MAREEEEEGRGGGGHRRRRRRRRRPALASSGPLLSHPLVTSFVTSFVTSPCRHVPLSGPLIRSPYQVPCPLSRPLSHPLSRPLAISPRYPTNCVPYHIPRLVTATFYVTTPITSLLTPSRRHRTVPIVTPRHMSLAAPASRPLSRPRSRPLSRRRPAGPPPPPPSPFHLAQVLQVAQLLVRVVVPFFLVRVLRLGWRARTRHPSRTR